MKKRKRMAVCILLTAVCLIQSSTITLYAKEKWPAGPETAAETAIVMEVNSGTVLYEKNTHERMYPASITKIMTALLAIEGCEAGEKVTFSYDSVHKTEGSSIWRDVDEVMTMEQCLYALMLNSANECAHAVAEHTSGSVEKFVKQMNQRAADLGCEDTHFTNPHGLPDEEHYTTSYDMALIGREAIKNNTFRQLISTKKYTIPPTNKHPDENTYLTNHHKMIQPYEAYYYEYCIGGKTGYTVAAGNTLVTFAEKDGMTLVCVVMGEKTPNHYIDTRALLEYCFDNFKLWNITDNETRFSEADLPDNGFLSEEGFVNTNIEDCIVLPVSAAFLDVSPEIVYDEEEEGTVGTLQYKYGKKVVGSTDIRISGKTVKPYPFSMGDVLPEDGIKNTVTVNAGFILRIAAIAAAAAVIIIGLFLGYRNFPLIRYRLASGRKEGKAVVIPRKRGRRRRR